MEMSVTKIIKLNKRNEFGNYDVNHQGSNESEISFALLQTDNKTGTLVHILLQHIIVISFGFLVLDELSDIHTSTELQIKLPRKTDTSMPSYRFPSEKWLIYL